jgi:hypothetical protein
LKRFANKCLLISLSAEFGVPTVTLSSRTTG